MHTVDWPTFVSILDLNMGFWMIQLDKECQWLATVILPWGKYSYQCLATGLSVSPNIYQEKMSAIFFLDMENVICFIDDIALITNGSFENHLNKLDEILQWLKETNYKSMETSPPFVQLKPSSLDFYFPNKESNLKSKRSKQLSWLLHQKQSNKSTPLLPWFTITRAIFHVVQTYSHHLPHLPR